MEAKQPEEKGPCVMPNPDERAILSPEHIKLARQLYGDMPEYQVKSLVCIHCGAEAFCPKCDEPKPTPPEVPAPDEVAWVVHDSSGRPLRLATENEILRGNCFRYVRAREGGR